MQQFFRQGAIVQHFPLGFSKEKTAAKGTISQEGEDYSRPRDMSEILGGGQDGHVFVDDSTPLVRPVFSYLFKRLCIVIASWAEELLVDLLTWLDGESC